MSNKLWSVEDKFEGIEPKNFLDLVDPDRLVHLFRGQGKSIEIATYEDLLEREQSAERDRDRLRDDYIEYAVDCYRDAIWDEEVYGQGDVRSHKIPPKGHLAEQWDKYGVTLFDESEDS